MFVVVPISIKIWESTSIIVDQLQSAAVVSACGRAYQYLELWINSNSIVGQLQSATLVCACGGVYQH